MVCKLLSTYKILSSSFNTNKQAKPKQSRREEKGIDGEKEGWRKGGKEAGIADEMQLGFIENRRGESTVSFFL